GAVGAVDTWSAIWRQYRFRRAAASRTLFNPELTVCFHPPPDVFGLLALARRADAAVSHMDAFAVFSDFDLVLLPPRAPRRKRVGRTVWRGVAGVRHANQVLDSFPVLTGKQIANSKWTSVSFFKQRSLALHKD